ncbi:MAG: hypothetical protein HQ495_09055 [Alphaproteobacteria bacterium]|nr:hypothetical protein [Alphaproteobacteria bacterium]
MPTSYEIVLDPNKSSPMVEVIIGQAQYGEYNVRRKDQQGTLHGVKEGDNADQVVDKFPILDVNGNPVPVSSLIGQRLRWHVLVRPIPDDPGQLYFVQVVVSQDGAMAVNGTATYQGPLSGVENVIDNRKFV